jgi:hypothetical protein
LRSEVLTRVNQLKLLLACEYVPLFDDDQIVCLLNETTRVKGDMAVCILFSERAGDVYHLHAPVALPPSVPNEQRLGMPVGLHDYTKEKLLTVPGIEPKFPVYPTCGLVTSQISLRFLKRDERPFFKT